MRQLVRFLSPSSRGDKFCFRCSNKFIRAVLQPQKLKSLLVKSSKQNGLLSVQSTYSSILRRSVPSTAFTPRLWKNLPLPYRAFLLLPHQKRDTSFKRPLNYCTERFLSSASSCSVIAYPFFLHLRLRIASPIHWLSALSVQVLCENCLLER